MIKDIKKEIISSLGDILKELGISDAKDIVLEHPEDIKHGDYSSNIALIYGKELKMSPKSLAEKILTLLNKNNIKGLNKIEIAGPGFINFFIDEKYFAKDIINIDKDFGKNTLDKGKEIMVEYTDPNPFKIFHIGHLMTNAIGESISRIIENSGAKTIRACYQGDVGMHVAKTVWAILKNNNYTPDIKYLGDMYALGAKEYEENENAKKEITEINKKIFDRSDKEINKVYDAGRKLSLEYFDGIYEKLGTSFNNFFFESEVSDDGIKIVNKFLEKGIFEKSEGATIFPGEKYGEHTRVFINSHGLPTYEAKEMGLTLKKFEIYPNLHQSIVVSANEINAYFKVIIAAMKNIDTTIASKMKHIGHGILRPSTGKMSSRKGNVVSATDLIQEFKDLVDEKMKDRDFPKEEKEKISEMIAIAGIKYMILRQAPGGDVIYDPHKAISFEGDSGPYLQYATVRAKTVLKKASDMGINKDIKYIPESATVFEKKLLRFPEILERARHEYAPQFITSYLTDLAGEFNSYYANNQIIDKDNKESAYRVALTKAFVDVMVNGLWILGIKVPERM
jgi:arginyl-tRNA synthetase